MGCWGKKGNDDEAVSCATGPSAPAAASGAMGCWGMSGNALLEATHFDAATTMQPLARLPILQPAEL